MYRDLVLSQKPAVFFPMDIYAGDGDYAPYSGSTISSSNYSKKRVHPSGKTLEVDGSINNTAQIGRADVPNRQFTIDLWTSYLGADDVVFNNTINIAIQDDRIEFSLFGVGGVEIRAHQYANDISAPHHVCCIYSGDAIVVFVDGVPGDPVPVPRDFVFDGSPTNIVLSRSSEAVAIFDRISTLQEIMDRYNAGLGEYSMLDVVAGKRGDYWDFTRANMQPAAEIVIDADDWPAATKMENAVVDKHGWITIADNPRMTPYESGVEVADATMTGSYMLMGANNCMTLPARGVLSTSESAIVAYINKTTSSAQTIMSIYDPRGGVQWRWYLDSSNVLHLEIKVIASDGSETTTTYNYANTVTGDFVFAAVLGTRGVKVSTNSSTTNQVSGSDWVQEFISITDKSLIIFGADHELAGPGANGLGDVLIYRNPPSTATWDDLINVLRPSVQYYTDIRPEVDAETIVPFYFPAVGSYEGSSVEVVSSHTPGLDASYGSIAVSNNGTSWSSLSRIEGPFTAIPFSGDMGGAVSTGPYYIRLRTYQFSGRSGRHESVRIKLYKTAAEIKSENTDRIATIEGTDYSSTDQRREPWNGYGTGNMGIYEVDFRCEFPSTTYRTVELGFIYAGGGAVGSLISINDGTHREVRINSSGVITSSGFSKVYVNGAELTTSYTASDRESIHVVAVLAADATGTVSVGRKYDNSEDAVFNIGLLYFGQYDYAFTADNATEQYKAFCGDIFYSPAESDATTIAETDPKLYALAWETTGATT